MEAESEASIRRTSIEELARGVRSGHAVTESSADAAVSVIEGTPAGFVSPDLLLPGDHQRKRVLLVEAAGAVGKSSTAAALAAMLGWPLVTAERAQVGSYSLSGLLQTAFGLTSPFIHDMARGVTGVIVDSLDEAHLKAGTQNFLAFLDDVARLARAGEADGIRLILMSRPDTADIVELALEELGVPYSRSAIAMFTRSQANSFIEEYLRLRYAERRAPEYNVPLSHPTPFRALRDSRFNELEALFSGGDGTVAADLLGYVPVLIAIAESLAVSNPSARLPKGDRSHASEVALLADIVQGILARDAGKFQATMAAKLRALQAADDDGELIPSDLFSANEQTLRLYARAIARRFEHVLPASLPSSLRADYENAVNGFLADHPFTRGSDFVSIVFSDFVSASAACNPVTPIVLGGTQPMPLGAAGPFFVWFVRHFVSGEVMGIPEGLVEAVLASWAMDADLHAEGYAPSALLIQSGPSAHLLLGDGAASRPELIFEIQCESGVVVLTRPIANLTIISDGALVLGDGTYLNLPDNFHVAASEIEIDASSLSISKGNNSSIMAPKLSANRLQTVSAVEPDLQILTKKVPPKLFSFRAKLVSIDGPVRGDSYIGLRAILMSFRRTVHNGLCAPRDQVERYVVKGSLDRQRILEALVDEGVISLEGDWYVLDSSALGRVGLSLGALKSGISDEAVTAFLARVMTTPRAERVGEVPT